jgi:diaminohydroxyphosphoribosylaminopyrimidine deaminase/5-amino-6-(5-phosphoribosylamino)uracil reductase
MTTEHLFSRADCAHMDRALMVAERGRGRTTPNPKVGAVIVSADGRVIGSGFHRKAGEPHAEIEALRSAGEQARGATLYCTLEPCCHFGRTGPCVVAIEAAGISRVVAAVQDPNPTVAGGGFAHLRAHGVAVEEGLRHRAATLLNREFFTFIRRGRPFIVLKAAVTRDGYIAEAPGRRTSISSVESIRHAHGVRAEVDAIGIGSGTMLADDPLLTAREVYRPAPLTRVVFDRRLRSLPTAKLFSTIEQGPVIIVTSAVAVNASRSRARDLENAGARLEICETLERSTARLAELGVMSLVLEGGALLHRAAWDARIVDFVQIYFAPQTIGAGGVGFLPGRHLPLDGLDGRRQVACGPDLLVEGYVHRLD